MFHGKILRQKATSTKTIYLLLTFIFKQFQNYFVVGLCLSSPPFPLKLLQEFPRKIARTTHTRPISLYLGSVSGTLSWRNVFSAQPPFQLMELSLATYSLYHSLSLASTGHPISRIPNDAARELLWLPQCGLVKTTQDHHWNNWQVFKKVAWLEERSKKEAVNCCFKETIIINKPIRE